MPRYNWLEDSQVDGQLLIKKMRVLRILGTPYTDEQIAAAPSVVEGHTEMDALIAYLQSLGLARPRG